MISYSDNAKQRVNVKHDQGLVTDKSQRRAPQKATALVKNVNFASGPSLKSKRSLCSPIESGNIDVDSCYICDDGGGTLDLTSFDLPSNSSSPYVC